MRLRSLACLTCTLGEYTTCCKEATLSHTSTNKKQILSRVRRIKGQVEAIERALSGEENGCEEILQLVASCRGALNGLMAELIEGQVRHHVLVPNQRTLPSQLEAADDLIAVVRRYFK
jgi:FrmR/RcnR family transcriptional regulator, repressor of frmRAB operon